MLTPATFDRISGDAQFARPFGDCQAFAVPVDEVRKGPIAVLFEGVGPAAIARRVAERVVDAVNRVTVWARPHVGVEVFELQPTWIDHQAFRSVAFEHLRVRVFAALKHARPDAVFTRLVESVLGAGRSDRFSALASARFRAAFQVMAPALGGFPAFAAAFPPDLSAVVPVRRRRSADHSQSFEYTPGQVDYWSAHTGHSITFLGGK